MKTRKELAEQRDTAISWIVISWIIALAIMGVMAIYFGVQVRGYEKQLSECQDQVPVWTLKFVCVDIDAFSKITFEQNFTDYNDYEAGLSLVGDKKYKLFENCEVIE